MILSVSRRTDIPNYYAEWFYNRIKEGFLYVRNPMFPSNVSSINLSPEVIDCIVFWTKNPEPMLERLDELKNYHYYFQFTLTGYGKDIEPGIPHKKDHMISVFQQLSKKIGPEKVIWRYDPILFSNKYTKAYHLTAFRQIAEALQGYTNKCVISFVDIYKKNQKNLKCACIQETTDVFLQEFVRQLSKIAKDNGIEIATCAEMMDFPDCAHNACIDKELIEKIIGYPLKGGKDKNQRKECGCMESIDVGAYDTCLNGCKYCYANIDHQVATENFKRYNPDSPFLCDISHPDDVVKERKMSSLRK